MRKMTMTTAIAKMTMPMSKADDYDGGDGDDEPFQAQQQERVDRVRVDRAYWRITGSVA